jgi:carbon-monoxide dehydrogenase small subunit
MAPLGYRSQPRTFACKGYADEENVDGDATVRFEVNGEHHVLTGVPADRRLLDVLRDDLGLTGTKESCAVGVCGVCTVVVDTAIVSSCLVLARTLDGASVRTVEGLAGQDDPLTALQESFISHGGFQCGICTPGQLLAATALLAELPHPNEHQIREWMSGNLCRCTGYQQIVESIQAAAARSTRA